MDEYLLGSFGPREVGVLWVTGLRTTVVVYCSAMPVPTSAEFQSSLGMNRGRGNGKIKFVHHL